MRCLIVEDEPEIATFLVRILRELNLVVDVVETLADARHALTSFTYDLVILDRRLPDGDGLNLTAELSRMDDRPGILMLTAMDTKDDVVGGLNAGADDYLVKPFEPRELVARTHAMLRRPRLPLARSLAMGNVELKVGTNEAKIGDCRLLLRRKEALILEALLLRHDRVVPRNALIEAVYGFDDEIESNSLDAQVSRLRKKLVEAGSDIEIRSMRGIGYILRNLDSP